MIIASAQMQMASVHASTQHHEVKESLRMWVGDQRPDFEGAGVRRGRHSESVVISEAGQSAQSSEAEAIEQAAEEAENDPRLMLLRAMLRYLMCEEVVVFNALETRELKPDKPPRRCHSQPRRSAGSAGAWNMTGTKVTRNGKKPVSRPAEPCRQPMAVRFHSLSSFRCRAVSMRRVRCAYAWAMRPARKTRWC